MNLDYEPPTGHPVDEAHNLLNEVARTGRLGVIANGLCFVEMSARAADGHLHYVRVSTRVKNHYHRCAWQLARSVGVV